MIHRSLQILAGALVLLNAHSAVADVNRWTSQGPFGGNVTALAVDPSTPAIVYAGTRGAGIFKSTDRGGNWTLIDSGLPVGRFVTDITAFATCGVSGGES